MTTRTIAHYAATSSRRGQSVLGWLMSFDAAFRQRAALKTLDHHMLNDIGLTEADRACELARPIWDAPTLWRN